MERKFILKETGEPFELGHVLGRIYEKTTEYGKITTRIEDLITECNVDQFIEDGLLEEVFPTQEPDNKPSDYDYYFDILCEEYGKSREEVEEYLNATNEICPAAVLNILLTVVSEELNKWSTTTSDIRYFISPNTGMICEVSLDNQQFLAMTPYFKLEEDAILAKNILKEQFELMYEC